MSIFLPDEADSPSDGDGYAGPGNLRKLARYLPLLFLLSVLVVAVYAGFVATHTFNYPPASTPITTKSCTLNFIANLAATTLATCSNADSDFNVAGSGSVFVTASSALVGGSGITLVGIQAAPLSVPCAASPPTTGSGVVSIPLPGTSATSVSFTGGLVYDYCIYYTSSASITSGSFTVTYSA